MAMADGEISSSEKIIAAADTNVHTKAFGMRVSSSFLLNVKRKNPV